MRTLWRGCAGWAEVRIIPRTPGGRRRREFFSPGRVPDVCRFVQAHEPEGDVYVSVLPRAERRGTADAVKSAGWLWCDIDGGAEGTDGAWRLLQASQLPPPHLAARTGGGWHVYWQLADTIVTETEEQADSFRALLLRVCLAIGGRPVADAGAHGNEIRRRLTFDTAMPHADPARADIASAMRCPCTHNKKYTPPRYVAIYRPAERSLHTAVEWSSRLLPPLPPPRRPRPAYTPPASGFVLDRIPAGTRMKLNTPWPAHGRHIPWVEIAVSCARSGISEDEIAALLRANAVLSGAHRPDAMRECAYLARWATRRARRGGL